MISETAPPVPEESPTPTPEQEARLAARRRFNRRYVYLPMALITLLWVGFILLLLWLTVAGAWFAVDTQSDTYRQLISGAADFIIMGAVIPWLLLCGVATYLPIGLIIYRRRQKAEQPPEPASLPLFWRIDNVVHTVYERLNESILPAIARPVITAHAIATFLRSLFTTLKNEIRRLLKWSNT